MSDPIDQFKQAMTHTTTMQKADNFLTLALDGKDRANQLKEITGWRGALAAGSSAFRKYGSYDAFDDGRRARRKAARLMAKATQKAGKA